MLRNRARSRAVSVLLGAAASAVPLCAQMHKVEKPERVTRAIGVYEWTGDMKKPDAARLIPVSLYIDSHFEDADLYLARPVPFTLETGDEYSIETAGQSLGLFDVEYARNVVTRRSTKDEDPVGAWYGYGRFALPAPPKKSDLKASASKSAVVDSSDDDQPHLAVRAGAEDDGKSATAKDTGKADDSKNSGGPTLSRRGDSSATTSTPAPPDDPDRPTLRHRDPVAEGKKNKRDKDGGEVIALNTSLNDDPNRPTLRRGVPAEQLVPKALSGLPPSLRQAVAVSDVLSRDQHVFAREWESSDERTAALKDTQALARPLVSAYLAKNKLEPVAISASGSGPAFASTPKSSPASTRRPAGTRKPPAPTSQAFALTNESINGYALTYGGLPTFVYTAEVPVATGGPVYLTLVTQRLPSGELQVGLSNVTDATHLNRVPWMRPVDVVDPDSSHRASFLMELRAQSSRQFALYRLVTAKAEQQFVTGVME